MSAIQKAIDEEFKRMREANDRLGTTGLQQLCRYGPGDFGLAEAKIRKQFEPMLNVTLTPTALATPCRLLPNEGGLPE